MHKTHAHMYSYMPQAGCHTFDPLFCIYLFIRILKYAHSHIYIYIYIYAYVQQAWRYGIDLLSSVKSVEAGYTYMFCPMYKYM